MEIVKISRSAYVLRDPKSSLNVGCVVTSDGAILIDTGCTAAMAPGIQAAIAGITDQPIAYVINAHACGELLALGAANFDVPVIAHQACTQAIDRARTAAERKAERAGTRGESDSARASRAQSEMGAGQLDMARMADTARPDAARMADTARPDTARPDTARPDTARMADPARMPTVSFTEDGYLYVGGLLLELLHAPGKGEGSLAVHLPDEKVLFAGDVLNVDAYPVVQEGNAFRWRETLVRLRALNASRVIAARGRVASSEDLDRHVAHLQNVIASADLFADQAPLEQLAGGDRAADADPHTSRQAVMLLKAATDR